MRKLFVLFLLAAAVPAANAHPFHAEGSGLLAGLAHPLGGVDHLLAMLGVGLWSAWIVLNGGPDASARAVSASVPRKAVWLLCAGLAPKVLTWRFQQRPVPKFRPLFTEASRAGTAASRGC